MACHGIGCLHSVSSCTGPISGQNGYGEYTSTYCCYYGNRRTAIHSVSTGHTVSTVCTVPTIHTVSTEGEMYVCVSVSLTCYSSFPCVLLTREIQLRLLTGISSFCKWCPRVSISCVQQFPGGMLDGEVELGPVSMESKVHEGVDR